jgi:eukaryotic-like serine/threonine-protein kinase
LQPAARPATRVVLAMISSICVTLINNALDTSPEQDPAAEERVDQGTTITLSVSVEGPAELTVPNVIGLTEAEATSKLEGSEFGVSVVPQDVTDESQVGLVLGQDPPGETEANAGDTVTITVGQLAS